jgi:hypothetical protein
VRQKGYWAACHSRAAGSCSQLSKIPRLRGTCPVQCAEVTTFTQRYAHNLARLDNSSNRLRYCNISFWPMAQNGMIGVLVVRGFHTARVITGQDRAQINSLAPKAEIAQVRCVAPQALDGTCSSHCSYPEGEGRPMITPSSSPCDPCSANGSSLSESGWLCTSLRCRACQLSTSIFLRRVISSSRVTQQSQTEGPLITQ